MEVALVHSPVYSPDGSSSGAGSHKKRIILQYSVSNGKYSESNEKYFERNKNFIRSIEFKSGAYGGK